MKLSPRPQWVGFALALGSLAPPPQDSRQALPDRAGRGRASAADSPQPRAERCAGAQPGTPRHVIARVGATREAGPARETGVGREVAPAREGPPRHRPRHRDAGLAISPTPPGDLTPQDRTLPRAAGPGPDTRRGNCLSLPLAVASRTDAGRGHAISCRSWPGDKARPHAAQLRDEVPRPREPLALCCGHQAL